MATPAFQTAASGKGFPGLVVEWRSWSPAGPFMAQTWVDEGVRSSEKQEGGVTIGAWEFSCGSLFLSISLWTLPLGILGTFQLGMWLTLPTEVIWFKRTPCQESHWLLVTVTLWNSGTGFSAPFSSPPSLSLIYFFFSASFWTVALIPLNTIIHIQSCNSLKAQ